MTYIESELIVSCSQVSITLPQKYPLHYHKSIHYTTTKVSITLPQKTGNKQLYVSRHV